MFCSPPVLGFSFGAALSPVGVSLSSRLATSDVRTEKPSSPIAMADALLAASPNSLSASHRDQRHPTNRGAR